MRARAQPAGARGAPELDECADILRDESLCCDAVSSEAIVPGCLRRSSLMSQAKRSIFGGSLKRNYHVFKDAPSGANTYSRTSQAKRETCRGCLQRNKHMFVDVSSEARMFPRVSQAKQAIA
eukprot:3433091-Pyramimonas_sp.AAC.1